MQSLKLLCFVIEITSHDIRHKFRLTKQKKEKMNLDFFRVVFKHETGAGFKKTFNCAGIYQKLCHDCLFKNATTLSPAKSANSILYIDGDVTTLLSIRPVCTQCC